MCSFLKVHSCLSKGHVYGYKTVQLPGIYSPPPPPQKKILCLRIPKFPNFHGYGNLDVIAMDIRKSQNVFHIFYLMATFWKGSDH